MTQNMVLGITHRVVKYSVVQKITELVANHYLNPSINQNSFLIGHQNLKLKISMSVCQFQTKGVYIVGSCSLPRYLRKRSVILLKGF